MLLGVSFPYDSALAFKCRKIFSSVRFAEFGFQQFDTVGGRNLLSFTRSPEFERALIPYRSVSDPLVHNFFVKTFPGIQKFEIGPSQSTSANILELSEVGTLYPARIRLKLKGDIKGDTYRLREYAARVQIEDVAYDLFLAVQQSKRFSFYRWETSEIFVRLLPAATF